MEVLAEPRSEFTHLDSDESGGPLSFDLDATDLAMGFVPLLAQADEWLRRSLMLCSAAWMHLHGRQLLQFSCTLWPPPPGLEVFRASRRSRAGRRRVAGHRRRAQPLPMPWLWNIVQHSCTRICTAFAPMCDGRRREGALREKLGNGVLAF